MQDAGSDTGEYIAREENPSVSQTKDGRLGFLFHCPTQLVNRRAELAVVKRAGHQKKIMPGRFVKPSGKSFTPGMGGYPEPKAGLLCRIVDDFLGTPPRQALHAFAGPKERRLRIERRARPAQGHEPAADRKPRSGVQGHIQSRVPAFQVAARNAQTVAESPPVPDIGDP